jgi:hypothetical protein
VHDANSASITTTSEEVNAWVHFHPATTPSWLSQERHDAWIAAEEATHKQASACKPKNLDFPEDFAIQTYPFMPPPCCDDLTDPGCLSGPEFLKQQRARRMLNGYSGSYSGYTGGTYTGNS